MQFLSYLANSRDVAINTQKSALNALAFLYNQFLNQPLADMGFHYAKRQRKIPIVISQQEAQAILKQMSQRDRIIFSLLYGSGLRNHDRTASYLNRPYRSERGELPESLFHCLAASAI